jgi:hypothetical protein
VPYPRAFQKRVLVPSVLGAALLVLLGFLAHAIRAGGGREAVARAVVSAGLFVVVALQVAAGLVPHARGWPFVGFTMYTDRFDEGDLTWRLTVQGVLPDGRRVPLQRWETEVERALCAPLIHGTDAERQAFLDRHNARRGAGPLRGFAVLDERQRLTRHGPVRVAPVVMHVFPEDALDAR